MYPAFQNDHRLKKESVLFVELLYYSPFFLSFFCWEETSRRGRDNSLSQSARLSLHKIGSILPARKASILKNAKSFQPDLDTFLLIAIGTGTGRLLNCSTATTQEKNEETLETYGKLQYVYFIETLLTTQGRCYERVVES